MRFTGSSHDEHGMLTKDPAKVGRLNEHLRRKIEDHADEIEMVDADLQEDARTLLISYGITARAMSEAANIARDGGQRCLDPHHPEPVACAGGCANRRPLRAKLPRHDRARRRRRTEPGRLPSRGRAGRSIAGRPTRRRIAPEIIGINRVDGELITPGQFLEPILS